jgi:hypothetical protein
LRKRSREKKEPQNRPFSGIEKKKSLEKKSVKKPATGSPPIPRVTRFGYFYPFGGRLYWTFLIYLDYSKFFATFTLKKAIY